MSYTLQFGQVVGYIPDLIAGAWVSLQLAMLAFVIGMAIGLVNAATLHFGRGWVTWPSKAYVTFFLNTPILVQIFFVYFALPDIAGIVLSSYAAAVIGLSLNVGAYLTEIQRAGFASVQRAEVEAAEAMGFNLVQTIRYVIFPHICKVLFPPLSNQYILLVMTTSICAIIGVEELTGRTLNANAVTFRAFELFAITAGLYVVVTIIASAMLVYAGRRLFRVEAKVF
jgi:polar amino acid transport system permease protein